MCVGFGRVNRPSTLLEMFALRPSGAEKGDRISSWFKITIQVRNAVISILHVSRCATITACLQGDQPSSYPAAPGYRTPADVFLRQDGHRQADPWERGPAGNTLGEINPRLDVFTCLISLRFSSPVRWSRPCLTSSGSCSIFPLISCFKPLIFSLIPCVGSSSVNYGLSGERIYTYDALSKFRTEANSSGMELRWIGRVLGCTGTHISGIAG